MLSEPLNRVYNPMRPQGRVVTRIAAYDNPVGTMGKPEAMLEVVWTINPGRSPRDITETLTQTYDQVYGTHSLSRWGQYQFDSMFKGWN